MIYSSEAIVLENRDYGEADLIVTYLTKEFGLINLFAKSPRKIRSKFGSSLEPLTYSKISFIGREERLQKIIQSDILYSFQKIRDNYKLYLKFSDTLNLIIKFLPKKEKNSELFHLLLHVLREVEKSERWETYNLFLKINILKILGYFPDMMHCGICGKSLLKESFYSKGFFFCKSCFLKNKSSSKDMGDYRISYHILKFLNSFSKWPIGHLGRVKINEQLIKEVDYFIKEHMAVTIKV